MKSHTMWIDPPGDMAYCTCGWSKYHPRQKILVQAMLRHHDKTGHVLPSKS